MVLAKIISRLTMKGIKKESLPEPVRVNMFYRRTHGLCYINNPKAACSTVKRSMLGNNDLDVHDPANFDVLGEEESAEFFTVVRNPYTRILSAFLNKVAGDARLTPAGTWENTLKGTGVDYATEVSFTEFLKILKSFADINRISPHFRPQFLNIRNDLFHYSFIGKMEQMSEVESYLHQKKISLINFKPHQTSAAKRLESYYNDEAIALVRELFQEDFLRFGYPFDIADG